MDRKKIISSLALAGVLTAGVLGANVNATTEFLKPVGVYKKLIEGKTVVPYVLKDRKTPLTVNDISSEFANLELVNGLAVTDTSATLKTGDTFKANGIEYTIIVYGDVNKDGKITTSDATLIQKIAVEDESIGEITDEQKEAADVNNNGNVTTKDALAIQKYVVDLADSVIDVLPELEDITAPVINGVPAEPIYIKLNDSTFELPEVTATDDYDGKVEVTVTGEVKKEEEGTYTITYTAADREGNTATATLTVVVDGTAPVISGVPAEPIYIKPNATYELPEVTVTDALDASVKLVQEGNVDVTIEGNNTVTYTATDKAGNTATATLTVVVDGTAPVISGVTDGQQVYINLNDTEYKLPEVTAEDVVDGSIEPVQEGNVDVTKVGDNTITYTATDKAGNTATATLTVTVDDQGPVLSIEDGQKLYIQQNDTKATLPVVTATDTVDGELEVTATGVDGVDITTEGTYTVTYSATDSMENTTTATLTVVVDGTAPKADVKYSSTIQSKDPVTVTIVSDEPLMAIENWTLSEDGMSMTRTYDANVENEKVVVSDLTGNTTDVYINISNIDNEVKIESVTYSPDEETKTNGNVIVTILAAEDLQPLTEEQIADGWELAADNKTVTKEYTDNVIAEVVLKDVLGNEKTVDIRIQNIDKVAPKAEVQFDVTTMTKGNVEVTIIANEELKELTQAQTDDGWTLSENKKSLTKIYEGNANDKISIFDLLGNEAIIPVEVTNIDKDGPELEVEYDITTMTNKDVTVTITSNEKINAPEGWTLSEDGLKITKAYAVNGSENVTVTDLLGNESTKEIIIGNIDKELPVVNGFEGYADGRRSYQSVTPEFTDPIATLQVGEELPKRFNSGELITVPGSYILIVKDAVGNETRIEFVIDNEAPKFGEDDFETVFVNQENFVKQENFDTKLVATDNVDGDIEVIPTMEVEGTPTKIETIEVTGENDGEYTLTYVATDEAGNSSTVHTKKVIVDTKPAEAFLLPNNSEATTSVIMKVKFSEPMQELEGWVFEADKTDVLMKEYTTNGKETVEFKDLAGNVTAVDISVNNIDSDVPSPIVTYPSLEPTSGTVTVTISAGEELRLTEELQEAGWSLSDDKLILTKVYSANTPEGGEIVEIEDLAGNKAEVTVAVNNIDTNVPTIEKIEYSEELNVKTKNNIVVTIVANEELQLTEEQENAGWTLSEDKKSITKTYEKNASESVIIKDLVGNEGEAKLIEIKNIDKDAPTITGLTDGITSYKEELSLTFDDETYPITVTLQEGTNDPIETIYESEAEMVTPYEIKAKGAYKLTVEDALGTKVEKIFNIDFDAATISGVKDGDRCNKATLSFTEGIGILNKLDTDGSVIKTETFTSEEPISITEDGRYEFSVTDAAGNTTDTVSFVVDTQAPVVTNIPDNKTFTSESVTEKSVILELDELETLTTIKLNGEEVGEDEYTTETTDAGKNLLKLTLEDGSYVITITDNLGNVSTAEFIVDTTGPIVTGVDDNASYNDEVEPEFTEGTATLKKDAGNAEPYTSGTISAEGTYVLTVTDSKGNKTEITFTIDKTDPKLIDSTDPDSKQNIVEGKAYKNLTIDSEDLDKATYTVELLKDEEVVENYELSTPITEHGEYKLTVTDEAGNSTVVNFVIDAKVEGVTVTTSNNGNPTKNDVTVTISADEEMQQVAGWTLLPGNKKMTKTYSEDQTDVEVTIMDLLGNPATVTFNVEGIDKTAPTVQEITYVTTYLQDEVDTTVAGANQATSRYVTVTITANEELQLTNGLEADGWTLSADKLTLTKNYADNTSEEGETVKIVDLAGWETETEKIIVQNIYAENPQILGWNNSPEIEVTAVGGQKYDLPDVTAIDYKKNPVDVTRTVKRIFVVDGEEQVTNYDASDDKIDIHEPSRYVITYIATDEAGRTTTIERIVNVVSAEQN